MMVRPSLWLRPLAGEKDPYKRFKWFLLVQKSQVAEFYWCRKVAFFNLFDENDRRRSWIDFYWQI